MKIKSIDNLLRSLFLSLFSFSALMILIFSILQYINTSILQYIENVFSLKIIGVLIMSALVVIFYAGLFIKPQARTSANLKVYSIAIAMGFFICTLALLLTKNKNLLHLALCLALATVWQPAGRIHLLKF